MFPTRFTGVTRAGLIQRGSGKNKPTQTYESKHNQKNQLTVPCYVDLWNRYRPRTNESSWPKDSHSIAGG